MKYKQGMTSYDVWKSHVMQFTSADSDQLLTPPTWAMKNQY